MRPSTHPPAAAQPRERILVVCTRYIGDTVLAIPFLRNLRRAFPDAVIDVLAEGRSRDVLADCPYPDELLAWTRPARPRKRGRWASLSGIRGQAAWLRSRGYARAYLLKRSTSGAILAFLAGIPQRVGFATECSRPLLSRAVRVHRGRHQVETYLDLLRADGIAVDDGHNENWVHETVGRRVERAVEPLPAGRQRVFLAVRGTDSHRFWKPERWVRLVEWLVVDRGCEIVLCGGRADADAHDALQESLAPHIARHVHDFSRSLSLRETGGLIARMDLCIGVDTGLVHLAASFGIPVAVLVGPTDPNQWCPWMTRSEVLRSSRVVRGRFDRLRAALGGRTARDLRWPLGRASMEDLTVAEVCRRTDLLLAEAMPRSPQTPGPTIRTIDLREGAYRYTVVSRSAESALAALASDAETA